jgi:hypothetical protein
MTKIKVLIYVENKTKEKRMNRHTAGYSKWFRTMAIVFLLSVATGFASTVEARQGCGNGSHMCYKAGVCVRNGTVCQQKWYHHECWIRGVHYNRCPQ